MFAGVLIPYSISCKLRDRPRSPGFLRSQKEEGCSPFGNAVLAFLPLLVWDQDDLPAGGELYRHTRKGRRQTMLKLIAETAITIVTTHYLACLIQMFLHASLGHNRRAGFVFREHIRNHHAIYSEIYTSPRYIDEKISLTQYYLIPATGCAILAFLLLPFGLAIAVMATFLASIILHVHFHVQYHLNYSWWQRFAWFRRRQFLHRIHHERPDKNFGVLDSMWDRLLGTYSDEEISHIVEFI
jgi:sterol desaturase/sphingolipid hydroxylase (fatty acid hydroxylase superfamily)